MFEEHLTCDIQTLKEKLQKQEIQIKGEFVIGLAPRREKIKN